MDPKNDRLTIRDYSIFQWSVGLISLAFSLISYHRETTQLVAPLIGGILFLLLFSLSRLMTLTIDRNGWLL